MNRNEVAFIKQLRHDGYTQRQASIIMGLGKSTISRVWNNKTYKHIKSEDYDKDQRLENKRIIFDIISECREIAGIGSLSYQDKTYIKLLKYCNVPYEKVRHIYYDIPAKFFRPIWDYEQPEIDMHDFDSTQIGIDKNDYKDFLG